MRKQHHWPSIDDWVCHKHNAHLMLFKGKARCTAGQGLIGGCDMPWLQRAEVQRIQANNDHWMLTGDGHVLRNLRVPSTAVDAALETYCFEEVDLDNPHVTLWWHVFGGNLPMAEVSAGIGVQFEVENDVAATELVWVTVGLGPVLTHAEEVSPGEGTRLCDGIALSVLTERETGTRLDLIGSWTHEPMDEEVIVASSEGLLKTIQDTMRSLSQCKGTTTDE